MAAVEPGCWLPLGILEILARRHWRFGHWDITFLGALRGMGVIFAHDVAFKAVRKGMPSVMEATLDRDAD